MKIQSEATAPLHPVADAHVNRNRVLVRLEQSFYLHNYALDFKACILQSSNSNLIIKVHIKHRRT